MADQLTYPLRMRRRLLWGVPGVALLALACAAALAGRPAAPNPAVGLWVELVFAPGDSIRYIARWTPPATDDDRLPVAGYDVQWLVGSQAIATHDASGAADSLGIPSPAVGDSVGPLSVRVRTRDTAGSLSTWLQSSPWWLIREALTPLPPGGIRIDTIPEVAVLRTFLLPEGPLVMEVGDTLQLCAYQEMADATWRVDPFIAECQARLDTYIALRQMEAVQLAYGI